MMVANGTSEADCYAPVSPVASCKMDDASCEKEIDADGRRLGGDRQMAVYKKLTHEEQELDGDALNGLDSIPSPPPSAPQLPPGYEVHSLESDGICDDGGMGAVFSLCAFGNDCADCGPRWVADNDGLVHSSASYHFHPDGPFYEPVTNPELIDRAEERGDLEGVMCVCDTPSMGTNGSNHYTCANGYRGYCADD